MKRLEQGDVTAILSIVAQLAEAALGVSVVALIVIAPESGGPPIQIANISPEDQFDLMRFCIDHQDVPENFAEHFTSGGN